MKMISIPEAQYKTLLKQARSYKKTKKQLLLPDFRKTLASEIRRIGKTVWKHKGQDTTSVDATLRSIGYDFKLPWSIIREEAKRWGSYQIRFDMDGGSPDGTVCLAVDDMYAFLSSIQPVKTKRVVKEFLERRSAA